MSHIYHICKLFHIQISDTYVNTYASNELKAIDNVIRSTSIHKHHIIDISPRANILATLHMYVLLHCYCDVHIDPTLLKNKIKTRKCNFHLPCYYHICICNKYAPHIICHMCKLLNVASMVEVGQYIRHI